MDCFIRVRPLIFVIVWVSTVNSEKCTSTPQTILSGSGSIQSRYYRGYEKESYTCEWKFSFAEDDISVTMQFDNHMFYYKWNEYRKQVEKWCSASESLTLGKERASNPCYSDKTTECIVFKNPRRQCPGIRYQYYGCKVSDDSTVPILVRYGTSGAHSSVKNQNETKVYTNGFILNYVFSKCTNESTNSKNVITSTRRTKTYGFTTGKRTQQQRTKSYLPASTLKVIFSDEGVNITISSYGSQHGTELSNAKTKSPSTATNGDDRTTTGTELYSESIASSTDNLGNSGSDSKPEMVAAIVSIVFVVLLTSVAALLYYKKRASPEILGSGEDHVYEEIDPNGTKQTVYSVAYGSVQPFTQSTDQSASATPPLPPMNNQSASNPEYKLAEDIQPTRDISTTAEAQATNSNEPPMDTGVSHNGADTGSPQRRQSGRDMVENIIYQQSPTMN